MERGSPLQPPSSWKHLEIVGPRPPFTNRDPAVTRTLYCLETLGVAGLSEGAAGVAVAPSLQTEGSVDSRTVISLLRVPRIPSPALTQSPGESSPALSTGQGR